MENRLEVARGQRGEKVLWLEVVSGGGDPVVIVQFCILIVVWLHEFTHSVKLSKTVYMPTKY